MIVASHDLSLGRQKEAHANLEKLAADWRELASSALLQVHALTGRSLTGYLSKAGDHPSDFGEKIKALKYAMQAERLHELVSGWTHHAYAMSKGENPYPMSFDPRKTKVQDCLARNLSSVYALICGADYLSMDRGRSFLEIIQEIADYSIDDEAIVFFNHLTHTAWAASQRFRGSARIYRDAFAPLTLLGSQEVDKDKRQYAMAAAMLLSEMEKKNASSVPPRKQLVLAQEILKDPLYMQEAARAQEAMFSEAPSDEKLLEVTEIDQKTDIAREITPFLGLVGAAIYLYEAQKKDPYVIIDETASGIALNAQETPLITVFVLTAWMAGQPFLLSLPRIQDKDTFMLPSLLPMVDVKLNLVLAEAAARFYQAYICTGTA